MACYSKRNTAKGVVWDTRFMADVNGVRKLVHLSGFGSKKEAEKAIFAYMAKGPAKVPAKGPVTVASAFSEYLESKRGMLAQGTLYNIGKIYDKHIAPSFEAREVASLVKADVVKWQSALWNERGVSGELLKNGTCKAIREAFSGFMEWASEVYSFDNPFNGVKAPHRREEAPSHVVWSVADFNRFDLVCAPEFKELFEVLFYSGCRLGEALALQISDFEFNGAFYSIHITKSAQVSRSGFSLVSPPKNSFSNRVVSLPENITEALSALLERSQGPFVFGGERPLCRQRISEAFNTGIELAGLPRIRIHDLRHSHASILISLGVPIPAVSRRLGHSSVNTTLNTYAHVVKEAESSLLGSLNSHISEAVPVSVTEAESPLQFS